MDWWLFVLGLIAGILLTIFVDYISRSLYDYYRRPILDIPESPTARRWVMPADIEFYEKPCYRSAEEAIPSKVWAVLYRLRIDNIGKSPANHVQGTLEFWPGEHRICWYEGKSANIIINAHDHSFLDVFAAPENKSNPIVVPTEHGWPGYCLDDPKTSIVHPFECRLRVTAANCKPLILRLSIDPTKEFKLVEIHKMNPSDLVPPKGM